jgi:hypothetical protein
MSHYLGKSRILGERGRTIAGGAVGMPTVGAFFAVAALTCCTAAIPGVDHLKEEQTEGGGKEEKQMLRNLALVYSNLNCNCSDLN